MDDLEKTLKTALRREPAPTGFAARVLARAKPHHPRPAPDWRRRAGFRWAMVAALAAALVAGVVVEHQRRQRARAEQVREAVMLALRITGSKLRAVQAQITRMDRVRGENP